MEANDLLWSAMMEKAERKEDITKLCVETPEILTTFFYKFLQ